MRGLTLASSLLLGLPGLAVVERPAVAAEATETEVLLARLTMPLRIEGRSLQGAGADWLLAQAAGADFLLLGEQHTTAEIGLLSAGLFERLVPAGYAVAAIEVGPWSTRRLESLLRDDEAFERYLAEPAHRTVFPFYGLREDADFLRTVIARSPRKADVLWGLDQEFVGAAPLMLDELSRLATSDAQRAAVDALREASRSDRMALAAGSDAPWQALHEAFAGNAPAQAITADILVSRRIYAPYMERGGSYYLANDERERYMKTQLATRLGEAAGPRGEWPKVFVKAGAYHLAYGHSPTGVLSLGTFVREYAHASGRTVFSVHVDCLGGESTDVFAGGTAACKSAYLGPDSPLRKFVAVDEPVVVDLRSLRARRSVWRDWDEQTRSLILAYDAYLALPTVSPAAVITGPAARAP
jgi:hypothetical protein